MEVQNGLYDTKRGRRKMGRDTLLGIRKTVFEK